MPVRLSTQGVVAALAVAALAVAPACSPRDDDAAAPSDRTPRIAVVAPAAAEMLDRLDRADGIVAVGDFVRRPERLTALPRLGPYDAPDVERLLELRVEVLVTADSRAADAVHERLRSLGIEVVALPTDTYEGVFESVTRLGEAFDARERAARLVARMRSDLEDVRRQTAGLPARRVLFVVGRDPLFVAGPGSHVDVLIGIVGGRNVAGDVGGAYRPLSLEAALDRMPEVIVDTSDNRPGALRGRTPGSWERWTFLPAVRDNRVWHVDPDLLVIPGVRMPEGARLLARLVHPEDLGAPADEELTVRPVATGEGR